MNDFLPFGLQTASFLALGAVVTFGWAYSKDGSRKNQLPYPPGPKPLFLIGNARDLPKSQKNVTYEKWYREYGDIVHVSALGKHIVLLNTVQAVTDLMERRSAIYSSRPHTVMICDLLAMAEWDFAVQPYGDDWRRGRRLFYSGTQPTVAPRYLGLQMRYARDLLKKLEQGCDDLHAAIRRHVGVTIIDIVYGIHDSRQEELVKLAEEGMENFSEAATPGRFLVDILPILRYVPRWFPGAGFHDFITKGRRLIDRAREAPMTEVKKDLSAGKASESLVTYLLNGKNEAEVGDIAAIAYGGGSDTTVSALLTFMLAMCIYPEVQAEAQAELDAVIGTDRMPEFADRDRLPYINALIWEISRWQPVGFVGLPHATTADDEYNGYFIPKGSIVLGNIWSILHNPEDYPEPEIFRPERYLKRAHNGAFEFDKSVRNPETIAFGFGRRVCPGRALADQTLYATVVSILSVLSISAPLDADGNRVPPKVEMTSHSIISHPLPFQCDITPRSMRAAELIDQPLPERGL